MSAELNGNPAIEPTAQELTERALALVETIKERLHAIGWHQAMLADADLDYESFDEFIADFEREFEMTRPRMAENYFDSLTRANVPRIRAALLRGAVTPSLN